MNKRVLYITNSINEINTLGYRHSNILKHLTSYFNIDLLNFEFTKREKTIFKTILNKLFTYPDIYYFNLFRYKRQIRNKLAHNNYDLVIIGVLPFSFLILASFIKKEQSSAKVIVDMTDPLTANVSYINHKYFHKYFINCYEKKHFKNIDTLIVLNEEIKNYYHDKYKFLKNIIVLEQGTNPVSLKKCDIKKSSKLELIYSGMFYKEIREPFKLYDAVILYPGEIRLSIYGSFKKIFLPPISDRFYYYGMVDKEEINKKTQEADIIVFIDNFFGLQVPGKILDCLATENPILFIYENEHSPTLKYVQDSDGVFFAKNNSNNIREQIDLITKSNNLKYKREISKYYWENLVKNVFLPNILIK